MSVLTRVAEQICSRRLGHRQAFQRHPVAKRNGKGYQPTERMTDEVDAARGSSNDGFDDLGLMRDGGIACGAAFGGAAVAK